MLDQAVLEVHVAGGEPGRERVAGELPDRGHEVLARLVERRIRRDHLDDPEVVAYPLRRVDRGGPLERRRRSRRRLRPRPGRRSTASWIGVSRKGGNSARRTLSTWRALASVGSTCASTDVNSMLRNGIPSTIRKVALASAIRPGIRITVRESRYQKPAVAAVRLGLGPALQERGGEGVHALAEEREHGREHGQRDRRRRERDQRAADPHRAQEVLREDGERRERGRHGQRREEHRAAGRRHRAAERDQPGSRARQLLAVARDDEQAVVDRQPEAEAGHEVEREDRDRASARSQPSAGAACSRSRARRSAAAAPRRPGCGRRAARAGTGSGTRSAPPAGGRTRPSRSPAAGRRRCRRPGRPPRPRARRPDPRRRPGPRRSRSGSNCDREVGLVAVAGDERGILGFEEPGDRPARPRRSAATSATSSTRSAPAGL